MVGSAMVGRGLVLYRAAWYLTFWSGNKLKKKKERKGKKKSCINIPLSLPWSQVMWENPGGIPGPLCTLAAWPAALTTPEDQERQGLEGPIGLTSGRTFCPVWVERKWEAEQWM